jgi:hypothetical protein
MCMLRDGNPELLRHVGQEVEISGRVVPSGTAAGATASTGSAPSPTASGHTAGMPASATAQEIEGPIIRMVASVCAAR